MRAYIEERLSKSLWLAARDRLGDPVGIYGLVDREDLPHPDSGYANLSRYAGLGYATEGAAVLLHHAMDVLGHDVTPAITNHARLGQTLGALHDADRRGGGRKQRRGKTRSSSNHAGFPPAAGGRAARAVTA
jgi:hypothetical protein